MSVLELHLSHGSAASSSWTSGGSGRAAPGLPALFEPSADRAGFWRGCLLGVRPDGPICRSRRSNAMGSDPARIVSAMTRTAPSRGT
jgi:hypothetical protein